jgi:ketosteroid isomerase-like protein
MRKFNSDTAVIAVELQQMISEFAHEIDTNDGRGITDFYIEDGVFAVGDFTRTGHAEIRKFYADGAERARARSKDGVRVRRHTYVNHRVEVQDKDNATIHFINVHYAGEGKPPLMGAISPAMVTECRMVCRRCEDGLWRIVVFDGMPMFVGDNDPVSRAALLKA